MLDHHLALPDTGTMAKIGRNQPCPCGSGRKFKHCHGPNSRMENDWLSPEVRDGIAQKLKEMEAVEHRRQQQQGLGKSIISGEVSGQRVVAVGARIYHSPKWQTFHDFLRDFLLGSLGPEWANHEQGKPLEKRHQILRWYAHAQKQAKEVQVAEGTLISAPMTGAVRAFMNLAYNIYLIAHHGAGQEMADIYLRRLKSARADDFTGALFETYAAAAFLKAGFEVEYQETKRRSTSCVEFVATWPSTGKRFSVEVKSRVREIGTSKRAEESDEIRRLRIGSKLAKALAKNAEHERVVMIEVNVPDELTETDQLDGWAAAAVSQIRSNEGATRRDGSPYPPAYVFVTNHAFHHDLEGSGKGIQVVADGFRIPDFGPNVRFKGYAEVLVARERHKAMMALIESLRTHYEIPATFDAEMPGSLTTDDELPRLKVGQQYLVPDGSGAEVAGRLISATVLEREEQAYGIYELDDGRRIIATSPLAPEELEDYRRYPDTFFDAVNSVATRAETFIEKCDFLYNTYQHSTREKLLEFMANATDIEHLQTLSQRELAIAYCERMAHAMQSQEDGKNLSASKENGQSVPD